LALQQEEIKLKLNEIIITIIKQSPNQRATFRDLAIRLPDTWVQDIFYALRVLQKNKVIESVKVSNRKSAYKLQHWYTSIDTAIAV
jgi:Fe2+ or Zn2+ uptake regulation protein